MIYDKKQYIRKNENIYQLRSNPHRGGRYLTGIQKSLKVDQGIHSIIKISNIIKLTIM